MLKIGVVGCGGIGKTHIRSYKEIPDVQVTHVCDLDLERAQIAADLCGAKAITDMKDFPDDLDAVSVVTPPFTHYKIVKQLLERGFNVFCEKPLTMDPAQGEELDALAKEKSGLKLVTIFPLLISLILNVKIQEKREFVYLCVSYKDLKTKLAYCLNK